jgi:hypothetical protein
MKRAGLEARTFRDPSWFVVRHVVDDYSSSGDPRPTTGFRANAVKRIMLTPGHDYDALGQGDNFIKGNSFVDHLLNNTCHAVDVMPLNVLSDLSRNGLAPKPTIVSALLVTPSECHSPENSLHYMSHHRAGNRQFPNRFQHILRFG